jgi:hypothetical protein
VSPISSALSNLAAALGAGEQPALQSGLPFPTTTTTTASPLNTAIAQNLATQDGLAGLFADLAAVQDAPNLPAPVRATISQILTLQPAITSEVSAADLQQSVAQSGVFLEAKLAAALTTGTALPATSSDLKALLLQLTSQLLTAFPNAAAAARGNTTLATPRHGAKPPPPVRGAPTSAQAPVQADLTEEAEPEQLAHVLNHDVKAALARIELSQLASTPQPGKGSAWRFELPVETAQGAGFAQFEISRDAPDHGSATPHDPVWKARFSVNSGTGDPVHAELSLAADKVRVTLWAPSEDARSLLEADQAQLVADLRAEEGIDAAVRIISGTPPPPPAAPSGQLVNRTS